MRIGRARLRSVAMRVVMLACVTCIVAAPSTDGGTSTLLMEAIPAQAHCPKATVVFRVTDCGFAMGAFDELEHLALEGRLELRGYIVGNIADGDIPGVKRAYRIGFALNSLSEREARRWMRDHGMSGTPALLVTDAGGKWLLHSKLTGGVAGVQELRDGISRVLPLAVKPGPAEATATTVSRTE